MRYEISSTTRSGTHPREGGYRFALCEQVENSDLVSKTVGWASHRKICGGFSPKGGTVRIPSGSTSIRPDTVSMSRRRSLRPMTAGSGRNRRGQGKAHDSSWNCRYHSCGDEHQIIYIACELPHRTLRVPMQ